MGPCRERSGSVRLHLLLAIQVGVIMVLTLLLLRKETSTAEQSFLTDLQQHLPQPTHRQGKRYAVLAFGLTRSTNWTLPSIEKHLFKPIRDAGGSHDLFLHTFTLDVLNNDWSGEHVTYTHQDDYKLLKPTRFLVTPEAQFDLTTQNLSDLTHYPWQADFRESTIRNLYRTNYSLQLAWALMLGHSVEHNITYDGFIATRSDVAFLNPVDVSSRVLAPYSLFVPEIFGYKGYNDRFAFGDLYGMGVYASRQVTYAKCGVEWMAGINPEHLLRLHLEEHNVNVTTTDLKIVRVRATGVLGRDEKKLAQYACASGYQYACGWRCGNNGNDFRCPYNNKFLNK
ncbi:hypothetical protein JKP88DRAFT_267243 [Tribonema minus]|uniref:DUF7796 domain-containing protein n=1 Tax=Tribonema minus TaxID=303371 RepID=A0A835ZAG8_9STRA|nr:hypothetical protein JKP88DRAFT_267243 [Tribonema minus]